VASTRRAPRPAPGLYDASLQAAVKRAQARQGLAPTGILDKATVEALNVTADARARQVALNMDRWRRVPQDLGARHLRVNSPAYTLTLWEDAAPRAHMRVITGTPDTPTPVLTNAVSSLEFRPYWNVPPGLEQQMLPRILKDRAYLTRERLEIVNGWDDASPVVRPEQVAWKKVTADDFPYRLRQRPGPTNSMGLLKFRFPNEHAVYLHDTPGKQKFAARERAFSNGCVRVEDPVRLAAFLLRDDPRWTTTGIRKAMATGPRRLVDLAAPVPVHLLYFTALVERGELRFLPDVYGWDRAELNVAPPPPSP
jgi:murein L,D-transpeptidase YcbB/YkuD